MNTAMKSVEDEEDGLYISQSSPLILFTAPIRDVSNHGDIAHKTLPDLEAWYTITTLSNNKD